MKIALFVACFLVAYLAINCLIGWAINKLITDEDVNVVRD